MNRRRIKDSVFLQGAVDWSRRLFDSLIPLPDGTSYNSYLISGSEKTALLDSVDPSMADVLLSQISDVAKIDYIVSHHAEQNHSGAIPMVLESKRADSSGLVRKCRQDREELKSKGGCREYAITTGPECRRWAAKTGHESKEAGRPQSRAGQAPGR